MSNILEQCPVPFLQTEKEISEFIDFLQDFNPKNIIEIGTFFGGTLWAWTHLIPKPEKIICVDWPIPESDGRYKQLQECKLLWPEWCKDVIVKYVKGDSTHLSTIEEVKTHNMGLLIDMLFIDGGHDFETVISDYNNYESFVKPGGIIVFHDIMGIPDVNKVWEELIKENSYKLIYDAENHGWGIGIIFKK
jgi:cephalosporin hydroxylase